MAALALNAKDIVVETDQQEVHSERRQRPTYYP
jgi:hypothetical protein